MTEEKITNKKVKKALVDALEEEKNIQEDSKNRSFRKCPRCGGENPDPECKHCWHCFDCGFTECMYDEEELPNEINKLR